MKITCNRKLFLESLSAVANVAPNRTPKDILKYVHLDASNNGVELLATDLEVGIRRRVDGVEVMQSGASLLPPQRTVAILRELDNDEVQIESDDSQIRIASGSSRFSLSTSDTEEFPSVSEFDASDYYEVETNSLGTAIKQVLFACDTESTRYALSGVSFEISKNKMLLVASDSRGLAIAECPFVKSGKPSLGNSSVVPAKAMSLLQRTLTGDKVDIAIGSNDALFRCEQTTIYSRLLEGRFPKWGDVVPEEFDYSLDVSAGDLLSVVRQAKIVTSEESSSVTFSFANNTLTLLSTTAGVGRSEIMLDIDFDNELILGFNPKYVADFLQVLSPDATVTIRLIDSDSPALMTFGNQYQYILMPMSA